MGTRWPDEVLLPKLREAHRELKLSLLLNDIPVINAVSTIITVPPQTIDDNNLDLSTVSGYPVNMISPIWLKERALGDTNDAFTDMKEVDFIPNVVLGVSLNYWAWMGQTIMLRGATTTTQVQIRYNQELTPPTLLTDSIGVLLGECFLAYQVAAKAVESVSDPKNLDARVSMFKANASYNLDLILRSAVKELQNLPAKRRAYHRGATQNKIIRGV